jgi:redox-sensitive bicupin YhaK (pirin superfamily)
MSKIELVIMPREKDLGGFSVRRILPYATHRMVGPFIFFDHMGPAEFHMHEGMDVRPHPHIGLATVTYLFEGKIRHRDSLGSDQLIEPGAINWMTAGRGIVHSERTPDDVREAGGRVNGIQCWVALPNEHEDVAPSFFHHGAASLPKFKIGDVRLNLLVGTAFGHESPVKVYSDIFYLEVLMPKGSQLNFPAGDREVAAYVVDGQVRIDGQAVEPYTMAVLNSGEDLDLEATQESRVLLLGGAPVGERFIYWNFVASSRERLEAAKKEWAPGPSGDSVRFRPVPGDSAEFIPLPDEPGNPKGTPL